MRLLKRNVLFRIINSYIVDSPQPANISYFWNFGSLLGTCLILQILTGVFLAMHYQPHVDFAFDSVEHIMREVNSGWAVRYTHANVASFFFIFVYAQFFFIYFELLDYLFLNSHFFNGILFKRIIENFLVKMRAAPKTLNPSNYQINPAKQLQDNEFLQWFVGFSDAESAFMINIKNNKEVHFVFQITLHIEDGAVLYTIKDKLGIGIVSIKGTTCSFRLHSFQVIIENLLPIFDNYPLLTLKQLNYRDWRKAILLKKLDQEKNRSLSIETFKKIANIKKGMNNLRTNYEGYILTHNMISKNWLVGFVEGDGSFYFSNSTAVFGLTQKDKKILEAISLFLQNIPLSPPYNELVVPNKPNCIIKNNKNAYQLVITDKDVLFQYIYPFFKNLTFYSRKLIDFSIWSLGLYLFIYGYTYLPQGKELLIKLSNNMNSKRYFSDLSDFLDITEIENLFALNPPFDIHSGKSHFHLAKEFSQAKGSRYGFKLHIYKNGIEIKGSPFDSFRSGGKAIGLKSVSSIRNYLNTGKIFKDGYTFYYSSPESNKE